MPSPVDLLKIYRNWLVEGRLYDFLRTATGMAAATLAFTWIWGISDRFKFTHRQAIPEKLLKYIPIENGGNVFFPFTIFYEFGFRQHAKTQWSSFDQQSFFPHSDSYKLKVAICQDDMDLLNQVVNRNFNLEKKITDRDYTPMALAAALGRVEIIEFLCKLGADINSRDKEGNTPLMLAVMNDHTPAIKKLVELGADLSAEDAYGFDSLKKASNRGLEHIEEYLMEQEQMPPQVDFSPVTYELENYEYLKFNSAKEIAEKYDPQRYFKPQVYPFFNKTQGMLLYFFGDFEEPNLEIHCRPFAYHNILDDRATSDQELFSFGDFAAENNN
mmetsp:Transcript_8615/g.12775  ORF Transcript_8615/g.12775 Transcript_8615/m.12775 type:complete len:329 (-) Transcript_8615:1376-2362(-)